MKRLLPAGDARRASPPSQSRTKACGRSTTFPQAVVKQKYGVDIDNAWLGRVQRSIARLEGGCTGSFASPDGLVLTNHHCAAACISELSSASDNVIENGFNSGSRAGERQCPGGLVSVLVGTEDITAKVNTAIAGMPDAKANTVRKQTLSRLESECTCALARPTGCVRVRIGDAVPGRAVLPLHVQALRRRAPRVRTRGGDRRVRRRSGQLQFPALVPRLQPDARLRERQAGAHAGSPALAPEGPSAGDPVFVAGHPGQHQPSAHRRRS